MYSTEESLKFYAENERVRFLTDEYRRTSSDFEYALRMAIDVYNMEQRRDQETSESAEQTT